jgi:hypothetical protein
VTQRKTNSDPTAGKQNIQRPSRINNVRAGKDRDYEFQFCFAVMRGYIWLIP